MRLLRPIRLLASTTLLSLLVAFGLAITADLGIQPIQVSAANTCSDVYAPLPQWIQSAVASNKTFYLTESTATGVPWEMLAAIHYRETNFSHSNPSNGQGIFQFVNGDGGPYPPGPVSDANFQQQLNYMAGRIQADYVFRGSLAYTHRALTSTETDDFRIQDTLYSYNGRSSQYAQQGTQYGFNASTQPYEGSSYVMNMFDCARANMGIITQDNGGIDGVDTRYGTYTLYTRLKNDSYWQSRYDFLGTNTHLSLPGCPQATNTTLACIWKLRQLGTDLPAIAATIPQRDTLITYGYVLDGTDFYGNNPIAPQPGNIPVYQITGSDGLPFYTTDANEKNTLISSYGYTDQGIAFYADPAGSNAGYPVYRLYSPTLGKHVWVGSIAEVQQLGRSGYVSEGSPFSSISSMRQETPTSAGKLLVYRFYIAQTHSHFWTTDIYERDSMIGTGYTYEGVAWNSSADSSDAPVYRLYAPSINQHLYTTDANEKNILAGSGRWTYEGISEYVSKTANGQPVYRLYAPSLGVHQYTADSYERSVLLSSGNWNDEGVAWYQP